MGIVLIERKVWERMLETFSELTGKVLKLTESNIGMKKWLDNEDVCRMLNISKRTLQSYRDSGKLAFSQINHKIYYKPEDVEAFCKRNYFSIRQKNSYGRFECNWNDRYPAKH
ncbi:MAG: helix-turn-helix domain-containing protein [Bacteroidales bacterium]|nr:helix-turn-helix domain-containing protein [Bacteroidales bacterium]